MTISWLCPICSGLNVQEVDYTGFPKRIEPCPWCAEEARKCAERIRERDRKKEGDDAGNN